MADSFVLWLAIGTTVLAVAAGRAIFHLRLGRLGAALASALEAIGCMAVFAALNLVVGPAVLLLARLLTGRFVSLYYADDTALLICACLQALVFYRWWDSGRKSPWR